MFLTKGSKEYKEEFFLRSKVIYCVNRGLCHYMNPLCFKFYKKIEKKLQTGKIGDNALRALSRYIKWQNSTIKNLFYCKKDVTQTLSKGNSTFRQFSRIVQLRREEKQL